MPIYEYHCAACGKRTEAFHRSLQNARRPDCEHCGSGRTARALSRFATPKTEAQVMEQYGAPDPGAGPDAYKTRGRSVAGPKSASTSWASRCPRRPSR